MLAHTISARQTLVLCELFMGPKCISELVESAHGCSPVSIDDALRALIKNGLAQRERHLIDKRASVFLITPEGHALVVKMARQTTAPKT